MSKVLYGFWGLNLVNECSQSSNPLLEVSAQSQAPSSVGSAEYLLTQSHFYHLQSQGSCPHCSAVCCSHPSLPTLTSPLWYCSSPETFYCCPLLFSSILIHIRISQRFLFLCLLDTHKGQMTFFCTKLLHISSSWVPVVICCLLPFSLRDFNDFSESKGLVLYESFQLILVRTQHAVIYSSYKWSDVFQRSNVVFIWNYTVSPLCIPNKGQQNNHSGWDFKISGANRYC